MGIVRLYKWNHKLKNVMNQQAACSRAMPRYDAKATAAQEFPQTRRVSYLYAAVIIVILPARQIVLLRRSRRQRFAALEVVRTMSCQPGGLLTVRICSRNAPPAPYHTPLAPNGTQQKLWTWWYWPACAVFATRRPAALWTHTCFTWPKQHSVAARLTPDW